MGLRSARGTVPVLSARQIKRETSRSKRVVKSISHRCSWSLAHCWARRLPGQGAGTLCADGGGMYEGQMLSGLRHGRGRFTSVEGDVYEGCWQHDMR